VGPWLAGWAEERFAAEAWVRVVARQQWTPELAQDLAEAETAIFVDCAAHGEPGSICVAPVETARTPASGIATHHLDAAELLALSEDLYGRKPRTSLLLTVGGGSVELREGFSEAVRRALPSACRKLEEAVRALLAGTAG